MKKSIAILAVFLLSATLTFGQFLTPIRVSSTTATFGHFVPKGTTINYLGYDYYTNHEAGAGQTLAGLLTLGYATLKNQSGADTTYLHSTGIDKAYGNYTFSGTNVFSGANSHTGINTFSSVANVFTTTGAGYFSYGSVWLQDSVSYFPSRTSGSATWLAWQVRQAGTPKCRMSLQNMANYSIQDKAGTGQVAIINRDTTLTTASVKLTAINRVVFIAATDTTTKTAGSIVYIGGFFWGCNGTFYYKLTN